MVFLQYTQCTKCFAGAVICPGTVIFTFYFLMGGVSIFQTLYTHFFRSATGENQSVFEVSWDIDSESRRFQLSRGTYPRLSQSNRLSLLAIMPRGVSLVWVGRCQGERA